MKLYSMLRHCKYSKPSIVVLAFNPLKVFEKPEKGQPDNFKEDYENYDSLSVSQKLELAFRQDAYGNCSPDLDLVLDSSKIAIYGGFAYGTAQGSFAMYNDFVRENKQTMFQNPGEAKRLLRKDMVRAGFHGGFRMALFFFCTGLYLCPSHYNMQYHNR